MLVAFFEAPDPDALGRDITARELLDAWSVARIEAEMPDQPLLQADLMYALGKTYKGLGLYNKSLEYLDATLDRRRANLRAPHLDIAEALNELGSVRRIQAEYEEAESLLQEAIAMWKELSGHVLEEANSLSNLWAAFVHALKKLFKRINFLAGDDDEEEGEPDPQMTTGDDDEEEGEPDPV